MKKFVLVLVLTLSIAVTANAQLSWDFVTEWGHPTQLEPWQYGYGTQNTPSEFIQFAHAILPENTGGNPAWGIDASATAIGPVMWRNDGVDVAYGIQPGEVAMHTGATADYTGTWENITVRWTAPGTVTYPAVQLDGYLGAGHGGEREVWVMKNVGTGSEETLLHVDPVTGDIPISLSAFIAIGDTIDIVQGAGALMSAENSPFFMAITEVPEPMTLSLLGLGGLALLRRRR